MKVIDAGSVYSVEGAQLIKFIKKTDGQLVHEGTTNEELIEVLLDRMKGLNDKLPCLENDAAIAHLHGALHWLNQRSQKRTDQGVETTDKPHES
jgi:hypothetical protein